MSVHTIHAANIAIAAPTVATILGWLPIGLGLLATILACVVYGLQIYDWCEARRKRRAQHEAVASVGAEKPSAKVETPAAVLKDTTDKLMVKIADVKDPLPH